MSDQAVEWFRTEGAWWACSFVFHMLLMCVLMLITTRDDREQIGEAPNLGEARIDPQGEESKLDKFEVGDPPWDPTELTTPTLTLTKPPGGPKQEEKPRPNDDVISPAGSGIQTVAIGPQLGSLSSFPGSGATPTMSAVGLLCNQYLLTFRTPWRKLIWTK
jgi:hypothetical protein